MNQRSSVLVLTIDSCRFDTFVSADAPNLKSVGPLHRAHAPSYFTFASHAAIFAGFTPGVAEVKEPYANPKYGKIFKLRSGGLAGPGGAFFVLDGENIIQGFKGRGYRAIGTGAVGWFDDTTAPGRVLSKDFEDFFYPGAYWSVQKQVDWLLERLGDTGGEPVFAFLNVGETHVPYYHQGADWSPDDNPCRPYRRGNDAEACRLRQRLCLEFVDRAVKPLLDLFAGGSVIVCADHGDAWGEDGLWQHGVHHETVLAVPLLFRLSKGLEPEIPGGLRQVAERAMLRVRGGPGAGRELVSGDRVRRDEV